MRIVFKLRRKRRYPADRPDVIIAKATDAILTGKLYLEPALKCSDVAAKIGTNRTYLWEALRVRGFGFQDYLSKFRIRHFIQNAGTFKELRANEIAEQCGFNNSKALNKYLKGMMGITLLEYMKRIEKIPLAT